MNEFKDKVIIITGASRGIGKETVRKLINTGAKLVLVSRDKDVLEKNIDEFCRDCNVKKDIFFPYPVDLCNEPGIRELVKTVIHKFNRIDVLINSAGIGYISRVEETPTVDWFRVINTNLTSIFLLTREVLPYMLKNKHGYIINIASNAGVKGFANFTVYCASKFGVVGFTKSLAEEVRAQGIKVCVLCPGAVNTAFWDNLPYTAGITPPREKILNPESVADVIFYLLTGMDKVQIEELVVLPVPKI